MASAAQVLANQANSKRSTGPTSAAGKQRSAANATKHGPSASFRALPHEDQQDFDELREDLIKEYEPADNHRVYLVEQLAKTWWTVARIQRLETRAFEHLAGLLEPTPDDPDSMIIANMFKSNPNALTTLQRYLLQNQNLYSKLRRELEKAQQSQNEANHIEDLCKLSEEARQQMREIPFPEFPLQTPSTAPSLPFSANSALSPV